MKKITIILLLIITYLGITGFTGLNPKKPIEIGDEIYFDERRFNPDEGILPLNAITYTYLGVTGGSVVIERKDEMVFANKPNDVQIKRMFFPIIRRFGQPRHTVISLTGFADTGTPSYENLLVHIDDGGNITIIQRRK